MLESGLILADEVDFAVMRGQTDLALKGHPYTIRSSGHVGSESTMSGRGGPDEGGQVPSGIGRLRGHLGLRRSSVGFS